MTTYIYLDNNYYLEISTNNNYIQNNITHYVVNIEELRLTDVLTNKNLLLNIDFSKFNKNNYKKIIKKLLIIKSIIPTNKTKIGIPRDSKILLGYLLNFDEKNKYHNEFIRAINSVFFDTRFKRYNYIYDTVCESLDNNFYGKNLCDFKDNKCGEKRNTSSTTGCCHHFKTKWLGPFSKLVLCEHLKEDYTCGAKCISCKLFTCDYLEKKGIKFRIRDFLLLDVFFNPIQKCIIKYSVFTPKNKILNRLMIF